jgi:hypothetical protein
LLVACSSNKIDFNSYIGKKPTQFGTYFANKWDSKEMNEIQKSIDQLLPTMKTKGEAPGIFKTTEILKIKYNDMEIMIPYTSGDAYQNIQVEKDGKLYNAVGGENEVNHLISLLPENPMH